MGLNVRGFNQAKRDIALYPTRPPYLSGADSTRGGILDRRELRHLRDRVGDVLHALWSHGIFGDTASNARCSWADSDA